MRAIISSILTPERQQRRPALFIDRDDTLIVDHPYLSDPNGVELMPHAAECLNAFRAAGYYVILISNQSGIGRGFFDEACLRAIESRICSDLAAGGASLDGCYYCPHAPEESCACRKPATGLIEAACRDFPVDLAHSVMIGDRSADIKLARAAGIKAVQIIAGEGGRLAEGAEMVIHDLAEATAILSQQPSK